MVTTNNAEQIDLPLFQQLGETSENKTQQTNETPEAAKRLIKVIRTVEFPLVLTNKQKLELEDICEKLKTIWNIALKRLLEFDEKTHYSKADKNFNPCCPINWEYRNYYLDENGCITDKKHSAEKITILFTRLIRDETVKSINGATPYLKELKTPKLRHGAIGNSKILDEVGKPETVVTTTELANIQGVIPENGCSGFSCPIYPSSNVTRHIKPVDVENWLLYQAPILKQPNAYGLSKAINNTNLDYHPLREELKLIPFDYRVGTSNSLAVSWGEYDKSRKKISSHGLFRGQPKFKRKKDKIRTVIYGKSPKNTGKKNPEGDPLKDKIRPSGKNDDILKGIPRLKEIKVLGLEKRWRDFYGNYPRMTNLRFVERPFGWTIQLTGYFWINPKLRKSKGAITADVGLQHAIIFDNGKFIDNPRWYRGRKDRIAKIQRQISQKRTHRLILWLNHPERTVEDIKALANISEEDAKILLKTRSEQEGKALIGQKRWEQLKRKCLPDSNAIAQLEQKLRHQHFKISQARKAFWDRLSTWLVRNYEVFICEDGLQKEGLRHQAQAKYEQGEAKPNQKKAKSGLTISLADLAPGMFMEQCERKFKEAERTFIRFPAKNSTLECPICDSHNYMEGNYPGQMYQCHNCGYEENRDQKAAIYIAVKAWEKKKVAFDLLSEPSKNAVLGRIDWQEKQKRQTKGKRKSKKKSS